jgi:3-oxoacyl-[acyl-carrier protein] reductase
MTGIRLEGQSALVTGGSRGIGAEIVRHLAAAGACVTFSYHRARHEAEKLIATNPERLLAVRAAVALPSEAKNLVGKAVRHFGRIDILAANAGIWNWKARPIERISEREWDEMMAVNVKGVYTVIRETVPHMIRQGGGRIIVVSSTAGQRGEAFHSHYGASKGALISLVKSLATELAPHRIAVNCVAPGWVDTEMCLPVKRVRKEYRAALAAIPMGRFAKPEEIAQPVLFLASDMASYITGEILNVNGGSVLCG